MISTVLVDDEPRGISSLKKMIEVNCPELNILAECVDAKSAVETIHRLNPQLVFLDIAMPGRNAFDMLRDIIDIRFEIIFVTAYSEYAVQAFKFSAVDYLLKPIDEQLLVPAVHKAIRRIENYPVSGNLETLVYNLQKRHKPADMKLCIASLKGFQIIQLSDILYCEAEGSYTIFHMVNGQPIMASKSIIDYELLLEDSFFCRVHKSYIINLAQVKEYKRGEGGTVLLTNGKEVEVSRRKKDLFLTQIKTLYKM